MGNEKALFKGAPGPGRPKGSANKTTTALKEAILQAADEAGGEGGIVAYLRLQAGTNPQAFLPLLGKVLPLTVSGDPNNPIVHEVRRIIVRPGDTNRGGVREAS